MMTLVLENEKEPQLQNNFFSNLIASITHNISETINTAKQPSSTTTLHETKGPLNQTISKLDEVGSSDGDLPCSTFLAPHFLRENE